MSSEKFSADEWIDRLAAALAKLAEAHEPYLQGYYRKSPHVHAVHVGLERNAPAFPLDDVRMLYASARHGGRVGEEAYYAPLCAALDSARYILISHPVLASAVGRIIGQDDFWMQILNGGNQTSPVDLIAGLMARAAELTGERFCAAAAELNAFLGPTRDQDAPGILGNLDEGYDAVLFWGLTLKDRIDVADGMAMLPYEQVQGFVDEDLVNELAPPGAGFHRWRSVGAVVRPFRWRPAVRRTGSLDEPMPDPPGPFFQEARIFLELLAVAHAVPVLRLANLAHCIDRSAGRLLGLASQQGSLYRGRSAQEFDGFDLAKELAPEALAEARSAFLNREGERYNRMAPVAGRLAEALARDGRFAVEDKILDVAIALERMYELERRDGSFQLKTRAACFLERDIDARWQVFEDVGALFDARSAIIHRRSDQPTARTREAAFRRGFEQSRRSLFRLLEEGAPADWNALVVRETDCGRHSSGNGLGTTTPGYRNSNDQEVIGRTDLPGNDHNQRIYVLQCRCCRYRYGANGSDIWQRKCPKCGDGLPGLDYE